mmetsp:Transcript_27328/g.70940  ORF Transcript_27328/g.70940 Transcript_27328/m.70940 type:complete len:230 (+) Transcript_27328:1205-1894(+)
MSPPSQPRPMRAYFDVQHLHRFWCEVLPPLWPPGLGARPPGKSLGPRGCLACALPTTRPGVRWSMSTRRPGQLHRNNRLCGWHAWSSSSVAPQVLQGQQPGRLLLRQVLLPILAALLPLPWGGGLCRRINEPVPRFRRWFEDGVFEKKQNENRGRHESFRLFIALEDGRIWAWKHELFPGRPPGSKLACIWDRRHPCSFRQGPQPSLCGIVCFASRAPLLGAVQSLPQY